MGHRKGEKCVVKFIGVVFIISGGLLAGHYFAEKSLIRIHILEELEQALQCERLAEVDFRHVVASGS